MVEATITVRTRWWLTPACCAAVVLHVLGVPIEPMAKWLAKHGVEVIVR